MMVSKNSTQGMLAEQSACEYLKKRGLQRVAQNYRCRHGEIDLVMRDGNDLVFVEVRFRRNDNFGGALASIDRHKQSKLIATAMHYLQHYGYRGTTRFDVIGIDAKQQFRWIKNAFNAS